MSRWNKKIFIKKLAIEVNPILDTLKKDQICIKQNLKKGGSIFIPNNKYTNEFKKKVIDEYVSGNESFYSLERKYNISNSSIKNWYYNFYKKGIDLATIKENRGRKKEENIDYKERYEILKKYQAFLKAQRERK